jgi:AcrR family transcriptional regulator
MPATSPPGSVWLTGQTVRRRAADPEGLSLERIVTTAVRMLDADSLAGFSMRRLAAELGFTPMSVYWYVATKDDLLERALDQVQGELALPPEDAGWRDALRLLATAYRELLVAHPWVPRLIGEYLNVGPHAVAFAGSAQRAIDRSGLGPEQRTGALAAVFQFVHGFGAVEGRWTERIRQAGMTSEQYHAALFAGVGDKAAFEEAVPLMKAHEGHTLEERRQADFSFALELLLAGIEAVRDRGPAGGTAPGG